MWHVNVQKKGTSVAHLDQENRKLNIVCKEIFQLGSYEKL